MEDQFRRIVREEIARALSSAGEVASNAVPAYTEETERFALQSIRSVMQRVARDVLVNVHPEIPGHAVREDEHTKDRACTACPHTAYVHRGGPCFACSCTGWDASTPSTEPKKWCPVCAHEEHMGSQCGFGACSCVRLPSTEPVHTITAVPERPKATCTCHHHAHVMGHDDRCGSAFCYCLTPVRARPEHTDEHTNGETRWTCTVCKHGVHDSGKCGMHVYRDGVAHPCPCLEYGDDPYKRPNPHCTLCEHSPHGGTCGHALVVGGLRFTCACDGVKA